jgi:secondary thiamine-phosphate synthase enzyme
MKNFAKSITLSTKAKYELIDLTETIEEIVANSQVAKGLCLVHASHATVSIICNEHESGLIQDILRKVKEIFPPNAGYMHDRIDDNASSHIASALLGASRTFPIEGGQLVRGTWQNIFLLELDGPRSRRTINIHIMGE